MNPLRNKEIFEKFMATISCNGCQFYIDKVCTEKNAKAHNIDKSWLQQDALNRYLQNKDEFSKHWADNIDDYYVCDNYKSKPDNFKKWKPEEKSV